jgi:two-component system phosphate regulon sensor histidine kinase PhoR
VTADSTESSSRLGRYADNLIANRWIAVAAVAFIVAVCVAGGVTPVWAAVIAVGLLVLLARGPHGTATDGRVIAPASSAQSLEPGLGLIAEALPDPCFILDRRGIVRYANRRAAAPFPIGVGDALTFRLRVPDLLAAFDRVVKGGPPERVEFMERVPTERWFEAWFARLDPMGRKGDHVLMVLDDMTERRRSERVRVDFVANASHELRTPLASLTGFIETLQGPARNDEEARTRFLSIMHEQAERMARLVDDLLSLSRIEMKQHLRPTDEVDLAGIVHHVADSLEPLARDLGVSIEVTMPDEPVLVTGDRDELIQVLENLIENACKYGQSGKRVVVSLSPARGANGPSVSVRDFGPGIAPDHLPRLTERFDRVDVEASRHHRGTGLGLAIVKHILARHRARMTVESTVGEGALFTVVFPPPSGAAGLAAAEKAPSQQRLGLS